MLECLGDAAGCDLVVVTGWPAELALLETALAPLVHDCAVQNVVRTGFSGPVDVAVLEFLEEAALDWLFATLREAQRGGRAAQLLVLGADGTVDDGVGLIRVTGQNAILEVLCEALADLSDRTGWVLQVAAFEAVLAPCLNHVTWNSPSAGFCGPVDGAVLEVNEATLAVWGLGLAGGWEAQPGGRAAAFCVTCADATEDGVCTSLWGPVSGTRLEILGLTAGDVVLIVQAGA